MIDEVGVESVDEVELVSQYFGLVHEAGHGHFELNAKSSPGYQEEVLNALRPAVVSFIDANQQISETERNRYKVLLDEPASVLHLRSLGEEMYADGFAMFTLCLVGIYLRDHVKGNRFDPFEFAREIAIMFRILITLQFMRVLGEMSHAGPLSASAVVELWQSYDLALTIRNNHLIEELATVVAQAINPTDPPAVEADIIEKLNRIIPALKPHMQLVTDSGTTVARMAVPLSGAQVWERLMEKFKLQYHNPLTRCSKLRGFWPLSTQLEHQALP